MIRLVAIGRRMKFSETFTPRPLLASRPAASAALLTVAQYHAATGRQPQLAFGNYRLTGFQTLVDHHILVHTGARDHRARFHGPVLLHNVNESAVLTCLHGFIGHYHGIR